MLTIKDYGVTIEIETEEQLVRAQRLHRKNPTHDKFELADVDTAGRRLPPSRYQLYFYTGSDWEQICTYVLDGTGPEPSARLI